MKLLITFFFLIGTLFYSVAQNDEVKWGELVNNQGRLLKLLPKKNNEFYALRWVGGRLLGSYQVTQHKDLALLN